MFGLEKLEQQQEKDRAEEERAREVELKEFLARELPEDLLDETYSETSSETSGLAEDHAPRPAAVLTHQLKLEGIPARQQPDSQPRFSDEQFFHSGRLQVASTPSVAKEAWAPDQLLSPLSVSLEGPLQPLSGEELEELMRLRILNEARSGEIRTLQEQLQQLQTQHGTQVQQLHIEYRQQMQELADQLIAEREVSSQRETQESHVSHLQQQLMKSEKMCEGLREENMRMSEELQSALVHLDNCKSQLETLCRADVLERLRDQHVSLIQQSDILHRDELVRVKEETDSLTASYQGTIRRMDKEMSQQNGEYLSEIGRLEQELEKSGRLSDQLRKEVDESELVSRVQELESRERDLHDENKQLELMLASLRTRCSEAEVQKERVARERDSVSQEMRDKLVEAEVEMKNGLEKCRSACLLLHEESCNRLREKSAQEQQLNKEMHEREVKRLSEEITNLKQQLLANKEGTVSLQEQLALREIHEREVNRLSEEITNLKQLLANKEGTVSQQEQLALREMHEREVNRLSEEITNLKQLLANKEGTVSLQEQLALREIHEREVNRLSEEITNLKQLLANKEGTVSQQEQLALREMHEREVNRLSEEITNLKQLLANKEGTVSQQEQLALREMHEREVNRLSEEITNLKQLLADKEGTVSQQEQLALREIHEREVNRLSEEITNLKQLLANKEGTVSQQEQLALREMHEREVNKLSEEITNLKQQLANKEGTVSLQEQLAMREIHEREGNRLSEEITNLKQQLANKEGNISLQEQLALREMHEKEVNRLSDVITNLKQQQANKEGTVSLQEQLAMREIHEREVNRLSEEITNLKQQQANKEGTVSLQEQLALREMHEREVNRLSEEITNLKQLLANKEGTVSQQEQLALREMHEREVNRLSEEITNLKQLLANKEGTVSLQEQLAMREIHEREVNRLSDEITNLKYQLSTREESVSALQAVLTKRVGTIEKLERELADREFVTQSNAQTAGCIRDAAEREVGNAEVHRSALYKDQQTGRSMRDDTSIVKYKREISQLREHIAKLETELSKAISNQRASQERDIRALSEERNDIYASTLETIRCAFREALSSPGIHEVMPGHFDLPLLEFYPSPHGTPALEFASLLREYLQEALLSLLRPVCSETNANSESTSKVQQAVSLALEHAKRQYMKSFSELKSSLTAKYSEKIAGLREGWEHERESLTGKLEESRETSLQLKRIIKECELTAESDKRRLKECELTAENVKRTLSDQLTHLQEQLMYAETAHRKSVQELSQRFARSVAERRDQACQTDSSDKRYRELFERLLTDLQRETEGVVNKKLAIIEEARRQETENARRMLDHNDQFLRRCRQVINAGKRGAIQDFHSSI